MMLLNENQRTPSRAEVDAYVGARIAYRRVVVGLTQQQLANRVGKSYQQVAKYCSGEIRMSAGILHEFAQALDVPVAFFFCEIKMDINPNATRDSRRLYNFVKNVRRIRRQRHREVVAEVVRAVVRGQTDA